MNRREFLAALAIIPVTPTLMQLQDLEKITRNAKSTGPMPVLFVGHGNPMNALEENEFTAGWRTMAAGIPRPTAILCISAHWETPGTFVTAMPKPRTIHDFGGFPQKLYDVQYPAPGSPELAGEVPGLVSKSEVLADNGWGLDHGAWTVIMKMYPDASVPVVQLSLDYRKDARYHYELAAQLAPLRERGVLVIGSGNLVHNLRMVDWYHPDSGYEWAEEAGSTFRELITKGDHDRLIGYEKLGKAVQQAVPTPEHYLPFLYSVALQRKDETVRFYNDKAVMGSLSMTSLRIGEG